VMIRAAHGGELETLSALAMRSKAHWGYSAAFMQACRAELSVSAELLPCTFVKQTDAGIGGFYALSELEPGRAELEFLFVEPMRIQSGYGRELVVHAREQALLHGWRVIEIQGDPNAVAFYVKVGAKQVGERPSASIAGRMLPVFELAV
jgi:GNAT superfamily N-acetyltransferase